MTAGAFPEEQGQRTAGPTGQPITSLARYDPSAKGLGFKQLGRLVANWSTSFQSYPA
jgi:hypothetical protein